MDAKEYISKFKQKHGRLPSQIELSKGLNVSARKAIQAIVAYSQGPREPIAQQQVAKNTNVRQKDHTQTLLRVFLSLLALMAFILSVYFTALWFLGKFHWVISGMISLTMVLFMVISPSVLRFIANRAVKIVVYTSFLVAMVFSMASTVSGQYNKTTERLETTTDVAAVYEKMANTEGELLELISEAQRDKEIHQNTISLLSATEEKRLENWQSIATERKYIDKYDSRIDSLRAELGDTRNKQIENGIIEEKRDFYLFISKLTGTEKTMVEFIASALPAVFIDIIASLCLNLALFIGSGNDHNETRKGKARREVQD